MNMYLVLPILIPFSTAIITLLFWKRRRVQRGLNVLGAAGLFGAALGLLAHVWQDGIQALQIGSWPAPFGITLVADLFAALMVAAAGLMGLAVAVYSLPCMDRQRESYGYYPLLHVLLMGVCGSFLTGDIFNLYVWFEVMLITSFVLVVLGGEKAQLEGAVKYVTLNVISSALFLTAVGILYGSTGSLNMADLAQILRNQAPSGLVTTLGMLFFLAFGIKAAVFPLFFWLPASYHTPPVPISAIFAGLLTKVGVYSLIRVFTLLFIQDTTLTRGLLLVVAGLTMLTGVLGAVAQSELRRLLSFHIVSQIGYMVMGLGLLTPLGLTGSIFFIIHIMVAKTNLFFVSGVVYRLKGTYELKSLGGLYRSSPGLAVLFLIPAFSMAGMPPLSGFWAKFTLVKAGLESSQYLLVAAALIVSLLTLFSMTKIWNEAFWKEGPSAKAQQRLVSIGSQSLGNRFLLLTPIVVLSILTVAMGLVAEPFLRVASEAAEHLLNPAHYVRVVLGD
jgi:multicomponent Na+:H+ antiporter subunit D